MARPFAHVIDGKKKVRLDRFDPRDTGGVDKDQAQPLIEKLGEELAELSNLLAYAGQHSLLVVMQGRDASGKDGAIRKVLEYANVLNAYVVPFKAPTTEERAHDFLWRVHKLTPALGKLALFNRSHYEDVIATRVHDLVDPEVWKARYQQINEFERLLAASNTIVVKFYLHVSLEEQFKRLQEREEDPRTAWKLNANDWRELPLARKTTEAYEEALERCSSPELPWYLVPADRKWFRNLAVLQRLVLALRPYKDGWHQHLERLRKQQLKEIEPLRKQMARELGLSQATAKPKQSPKR